MSNTFGEFAVAVAFGEDASRTMTQQDTDRAHREMYEAIAPCIEAIRSEQRKVSDDALSVMVF
jgi:hypothetical protein|nr:hypothetical protein [Luteibacter rhizovicinus]